MSTSYDELHPIGTETKETYCQRLQDEGHEEAFIRKALATHYEMPVSEMAAFFENFELARLRHIQLLTEIHPNRSDYSLMKKVAKNCGVTDERAIELLERFHNTDPEKLKRIC